MHARLHMHSASLAYWPCRSWSQRRLAVSWQRKLKLRPSCSTLSPGLSATDCRRRYDSSSSSELPSSATPSWLCTRAKADEMITHLANSYLPPSLPLPFLPPSPPPPSLPPLLQAGVLQPGLCWLHGCTLQLLQGLPASTQPRQEGLLHPHEGSHRVSGQEDSLLCLATPEGETSYSNITLTVLSCVLQCVVASWLAWHTCSVRVALRLLPQQGGARVLAFDPLTGMLVASRPSNNRLLPGYGLLKVHVRVHVCVDVTCQWFPLSSSLNNQYKYMQVYSTSES